jgi:hypothetical protein
MALNLEVVAQVSDDVRIAIWTQTNDQTVYTVQERNPITGGYSVGYFKFTLEDAEHFAADRVNAAS